MRTNCKSKGGHKGSMRKNNKYFLGGSVQTPAQGFDSGTNIGDGMLDSITGTALNSVAPGLGSVYQGASGILNGVVDGKKTINSSTGMFDDMNEAKQGNALRSLNPINNVTDGITGLFDSEASTKEKIFGALGTIGPLGFLGAKSNDMELERQQAENIESAQTSRNDIMKNNIQALTGNKLAMGGQTNPNMQGLNEFNVGGSHEQNSMGGIPVSFDANGVPNTVEEGETMDNGYVFSDRLKLTSPEAFKLSKQDSGKSYSEISKSLNKGLSERPNDAISKRTYKEMSGRLKTANDYANTMNIFSSNQFANGGEAMSEINPLMSTIDSGEINPLVPSILGETTVTTPYNPPLPEKPRPMAGSLNIFTNNQPKTYGGSKFGHISGQLDYISDKIDRKRYDRDLNKDMLANPGLYDGRTKTETKYTFK